MTARFKQANDNPPGFLVHLPLVVLGDQCFGLKGGSNGSIGPNIQFLHGNGVMAIQLEAIVSWELKGTPPMPPPPPRNKALIKPY